MGAEKVALSRVNLIRVVSCLLVATFHVVGVLNMGSRDVHIDMGWLAAPGFHLFLLISGVVLTYTTKSHDSAGVFMVKRVARMAPLYWLMTLGAVALAIWRPWTFSHFELGAAAIAKSLLFIPYADLHGRMMPILYVGWALNYTMLFYALFALSLSVAERWRTPTVVGSLMLVMGAAHLLPEGDLRRFYANPILLEFAAGAIVGRLLLTESVGAWIRNHPMAPYLIGGGMAMFAATLLDLPDALRSITFAATGAIVLFAAAGSDIYRAQLRSRTVDWLANLSYAILLVHPLLIPLIVVPLGARIDDEWARFAIIVPAFLLASVALAHVVHSSIERPVNSLLRRALTQRRSQKSPAPQPAH